MYRRKRREALEKRRGLAERIEERVKVASSTNNELPSCSRFKYLGTTVAPRQGLMPEITRRAGMAIGVAAGLKRVWSSKRLGRKLKKQVFEALVLTIALYNAEAWDMTKQEEEQARIWYMKLARLTVGKRRKMGDNGSWETNDAFLKKVGLDRFDQLLYKRKVIWLGHLARRMEEDEGARKMLEQRDGTWWERMTHELAIRGCTVDRILQLKNSRADLMKKVVLVDRQNFQ